MKNVVLFHEVKGKDVGKVGGKGANLGEMVNANFPVPPGFIVTAKAYFDFIEKTGIKEKLIETIDSIDVDNTEELKKAAKKARETVKNVELDEELKKEIINAYCKLGEQKLAWLTSSERAYVAVRSSATAEDLPEASFAGQQETFLNVHGKEALLEAVKNCWASLFTARAVFYRKKQGFPTDKVGIAVVVQKMVNSEQSGVMFTADPTGNNENIIIEACYGLGETIVSGSITPDTYIVDKKAMKIIEKKIGMQAWLLKRENGKNKKVTINSQKASKQKIPDSKIIEIAKLGKQIEAHYKKPQDIEWAVDDHSVKILQSRPITTMALKDIIEKDSHRREEIEKLKTKILVDGLAAGPGIASGKVAVVTSIKGIDKVKEGSILITKMTNPDWVPIMKKSSAIVTDEGGTTCHAAIVSRELGIPCIVGAQNATKELKDNLEVTVDGYNGFVYDGIIEIKKPEKTKEKIIKLKEIDMLEKAIELGIESQEKERYKVLQEKAVYMKPKLGLDGMAKQVKEERETLEELKEEKEKEQERLRKIKEMKKNLEKASLERGKIGKLKKEAGEIIEKFGNKKAETMSKKEIEEETEMLSALLQEISAKVKVNVALPEAAKRAAESNAAGVGLLRAEHMIASKGTHPAEYIRQKNLEGLVQVVHDGIEAVLKEFKGKPVWYRTFDARTDEFRNLEGGKYEPHEENPMLGWHGIRRDLDQPEMLKAQFLAVKKLLEEGYGNIGIMLPFVHSAEQVREAKKIAIEAGLKPEKGMLEFGVMIEVPSASLTIKEIIKEGIDFISFGTNDLTQLTLGLDRNNERIQKHFNELHPGVLKQIQIVIEECKKAGVKTSICGQAANNPEMAEKLILYGIDSISANIDSVEEVRRTVLREEKKLLLKGIKETGVE